MSTRVAEITPDRRSAIGPLIRQLERGISYPLGDDRFELDHGSDYFAFFDRLGATSTFVALDGERVVGAATGVLRRIARPDGTTADAWYCCDLKVSPDYRGRRLPIRILLAAMRTKYRRCRRGYGIAMRSPDGRPAPAVRLASHIRVIGSTVGEELLIYTMDAEEMARVAPLVQQHRGQISYTSLAGRKDLILHSTGRPMPLLHVQFGPCAVDGGREPREGHLHMFCSPATDELARALSAAGVCPSGSANILHHGMKRWDWRFVLTSDL